MSEAGLLRRLPAGVSICEVAPRDGLQNEPTVIATEQKRELILALCATGLRRIEIASFVSPSWIPQLADADAVAKVRAPAGVVFSALCPNAKGVERARAAGIEEVAVFLSASETHCKRNTNRTIGQALDVYTEVVPLALESGMRVRAYLSTAWGCPYEGAVPPERVAELAARLLGLGCYEVSLGDTIGIGTPLQTERILSRVLSRAPASKVALHLHDTRGTALANTLVGLAMGICTYDASVGGIGGCPYAPGASGNVATEDLVFMLQGMGIETGVDLGALLEAARVAERVVGHPLTSKVYRAGLPGTRI